MRTTCIITCYNYARFVRAAVDSALSQSVKFDEIVVVDDASSDDTASVLALVVDNEKTVKVIRHSTNMGQLAAFETGVLNSSGDIIFFLDADDVFAKDYLATAMLVYQTHANCDFLMAGNIEFNVDASQSFSLPESQVSPPELVDFGLTMLRTIAKQPFIGAPTSCLSMKRWVATKLFPLPLHEDWITRADDCLVFGASIVGARKFKIKRCLVGYRIHGQNSFAGTNKAGLPANFFLRQVAIHRLIIFLCRRFLLKSDLLRYAHLEFKTNPEPAFSDLLEYAGYVLKYGAYGISRLRGLAIIFKWYLVSGNGKKP